MLAFAMQIIVAQETFRFQDEESSRITIKEGESRVLTYQYANIVHSNVPENDKRREAGCYIHPLYGLYGEVLTDNAPKDHFHQHGVFWVWPHVVVHEPDGKRTRHNMWEATTSLKQHHIRFLKQDTTDGSAILSVENGWFVGDPKNNEKMMSETVTITVHRVKKESDGLKGRAIDFDFLWIPTEHPISLQGAEGKSYGGLAVRLRPFVAEGKTQAEPNAINTITVPSGIAKGDLPDTPLAWTDYTSQFGAKLPDGTPLRTGLAIFVPRSHPDFPPTWLTRYYGPLCVGWPGVKGRQFQKGEEIRLSYRIWVHDAPVSVEKIEDVYKQFH